MSYQLHLYFPGYFSVKKCKDDLLIHNPYNLDLQFDPSLSDEDALKLYNEAKDLAGNDLYEFKEFVSFDGFNELNWVKATTVLYNNAEDLNGQNVNIAHIPYLKDLDVQFKIHEILKYSDLNVVNKKSYIFTPYTEEYAYFYKITDTSGKAIKELTLGSLSKEDLSMLPRMGDSELLKGLLTEPMTQLSLVVTMDKPIEDVYDILPGKDIDNYQTEPYRYPISLERYKRIQTPEPNKDENTFTIYIDWYSRIRGKCEIFPFYITEPLKTWEGQIQSFKKLKFDLMRIALKHPEFLNHICKDHRVKINEYFDFTDHHAVIKGMLEESDMDEYESDNQTVVEDFIALYLHKGESFFVNFNVSAMFFYLMEAKCVNMKNPLLNAFEDWFKDAKGLGVTGVYLIPKYFTDLDDDEEIFPINKRYVPHSGRLLKLF